MQHSRYDSSDGRQRHSALICEQMLQKQREEMYGQHPGEVETPLEIMLKRFKLQSDAPEQT
jgi:hypothetical protein